MRRFIYILTLILVGWGSNASAQNTFNIDRECYEIYERSRRQMNDSARYFSVLRHGIEVARKKKDRKAENVMVCQELQYYLTFNRYQGVKSTAEKLRKLAKESKYWQYYYFAYQSQIEYCFANSRQKEGRMLMDEMRTEAIAQADATSKWYTYKTMGLVYLHQGMYDLAEQYLNQSLEIARDLKPRQSTASIYWALAEMKPDPRVRLHLCELAAQRGTSDYDRTQTYAYKALAYALLNDDTQFFEYYNRYIKEVGPIEAETESPTIRAMYAMRVAFDGDVDRAYQLCYDYRYQHYCQEILINIAKRHNDFKRACMNLHGYIMYTRERNAESEKNQMEELSAFFENGRLKNEMEQQTRQIAKSRSEQMEADRDNEKMLTNSKILRLAASDQELINRQLEHDRYVNESNIKSENSKLEHRKADQLRAESRHRLLLSLVVAISLLLIGTAVFLYASYQRRTSVRLLKYMRLLHKASIEAREASLAKTEFIKNMSHEIRTPLNAVVGFSQVLASDIDLDVEDRVQYSSLIFSNSRILNMLIDDVLNISDIENGKSIVNIQPNNINRICESAIEQSRYRLSEGVEIDYITDIPADYIAETDARHIMTVLLCLLSNACKFTQKGKIELHSSLEERPGFIVFHVKDTGIGIPEDKYEFVFRRFAKVNDFIQGAGLGLSLCRNIATALKGRVYIASSSPQGTDMAFEVPIKGMEALRVGAVQID